MTPAYRPASDDAGESGSRSATPPWFASVLSARPDRRFVEVEGAKIELLIWGDPGLPGILLVPGLLAHADWWSFIAPFFLPDHRIAAISLSGMGRSDHRETYSLPLHAQEVLECAAAAGLYESEHKPVLVGHSHGGWVVFQAAMTRPGQMAGCALVDTSFVLPRARLSDRTSSTEPRRQRFYATEADALEHFRLYPSQPCENSYLVDFIARGSVAYQKGGRGDLGWTWRSDRDLLTKLSSKGMRFRGDASRITHFVGERSFVARLVRDSSLSFLQDMKTVLIPEAAHHVMLDQPLALVSALRTLLSQLASPA